jgi:hypothetical protein
VRFYVRVDVFAGVRRFRATWGGGQFFIQKAGEETCFFSLLFFGFWSLFWFFGLSLSAYNNKKNTVTRREEEKKKKNISASRDA